MLVGNLPAKLAILLSFAVSATSLEAATRVTKASFGQTPDGTPVDIYTLDNGKLEARITTYGGIVVSREAPDRNGKMDDVVLGFDSLQDYVTKNNPFFGEI